MFLVKHPVKSRIQVKTFTLPALCMLGAHLFLQSHISNSQRPHTVCCMMRSMPNCFLALSAGCDSTSHAKRVRSKATTIGPFMWEQQNIRALIEPLCHHLKITLPQQNTAINQLNRLTPNDPYMGHTAPLTSKRCILYIYSTNIGTEYFKHAL